MEFGSAILADLWGYETRRTPTVFEQKRLALGREVRAGRGGARHGPFFAGEDFSLVDAVFAPVFRYFEVFDTLIDSRIFATLPKVDAWRKALARSPERARCGGARIPAAPDGIPEAPRGPPADGGDLIAAAGSRQ